MWPFNKITNALKSRKIRRQCLNEILNALEARGIALLECRLTTKKRNLPLNSTSIHIDKMEEYRIANLRYSLDFWIEELVKDDRSGSVQSRVPIPVEFKHVIDGYEYGIIGSTRNPNYNTQIAKYHAANIQIEDKVKEIAQEIGGIWYIYVERKVWNDEIAYQNRLERIPSHRISEGPVLHLKGPNIEDWAKEQDVWKHVWKMYECAHSCWEEITMREWEEKAKKGLCCNCCGGQGYFPLNDPPYSATCKFCGGTGNLYVSIEEVRSHFEPHEPKLVFTPFSRQECEQEARKRGFMRSQKPLEIAYVYMKITSKV